MNLIPQTFNKLRAKLDRPMSARPFSSLSAHKSIKHHEKLGAMLGIENPFFRSTEGPQGRMTLIDGKPCLNFAWCDYLGLSQHPTVIEAAKAAIDRYGTSVSASRMVSGDTPLHRELEQEIADTIGVDACTRVRQRACRQRVDHRHAHDRRTTSSCTTSSCTTAPSSACACRAPRCARFRHNNLDALEKILKEERANYRNALVVIEGLYSTEGDIPDLPASSRSRSATAPG